MIGSLATIERSDTFHLTSPGLRSAWVNRHNSRQGCNQDSLSTSQKQTCGRVFLHTGSDTSCEEIMREGLLVTTSLQAESSHARQRELGPRAGKDSKDKQGRSYQ
jgi:hypothetical protein